MVSIDLTLQDIAKLSSRVAVVFISLPAVSTIPAVSLMAFSIFFFNFSYFNKYVIFLTVSQGCISLLDNDVEHFFHVLIYHMYVLFGEESVQDFAPFLKILSVKILNLNKYSASKSTVGYVV